MRELVVGGTPYLIFYRVRAKRVTDSDDLARCAIQITPADAKGFAFAGYLRIYAHQRNRLKTTTLAQGGHQLRIFAVRTHRKTAPFLS